MFKLTLFLEKSELSRREEFVGKAVSTAWGNGHSKGHVSMVPIGWGAGCCWWAEHNGWDAGSGWGEESVTIAGSHLVDWGRLL